MRLVVAVALLSGAALGFEVLLVRLFSIAHWHHFAYMIISLALLGYGAAGTFLSFTRARLLARFPLSFGLFAALFGVSVPAAFALSAAVPLNVLEIVWDPRQRAYLPLVYAILTVPFFFAATGIGLALTAAGRDVGRIYRGDLIGAAIGALAVVGGLHALPPGGCLVAIGAVGLVAAAFACWDDEVPPGLPVALTAAAALLVWAWPADWATAKPSPYKELSLALSIPDSEIVAERFGPLGLLTVVHSPTVPFRHAPGLSLAATTGPPEQLGLFIDGGGMTAITRFDGRLEPFAYLDQQTAALPFHLLDRPRVLVLGAGTGLDVLLALRHDARSVDAVEINPQLIELVADTFAAFAGGIYDHPAVTLRIAEARSFVAATERRFDLIHLALLDSFSAAAAGLHALNESYLYTVEAFQTYLDTLAPDGFLSVTRWLRSPPRDGLKLFATALTALERRGVAAPGDRLALVHGWQTVTLLVKNGPLTDDDVTRLRAFVRDRGFDVAFYPGIDAAEPNRFSVFDRPYLFEGAAALLGPDRRRFLADYPFIVAPATDDRPYFSHFLKWRTLVELLRPPERSGVNLVEWGYPVVAATLLQAGVASAVLILLPLAAFRWRTGGGRPPRRLRWRVAVYFSALGLAFLFVEIAFIQRFQLFLGHPLAAVAVVLFGFLLFAGLGSGAARPGAERLRWSSGRMAAVAAAAIVVFASGYLVVLPALFAALAGLPAAAKVAVALALIAPIGFFMGMPFPLGLGDTAAEAPELVPWAWGINGCASVLSAVLATLLAIHVGFSVVVVLALVLYALAASTFPAATTPGAGTAPRG